MGDFGTKIHIITRFPSIKAQARPGYKEKKTPAPKRNLSKAEKEPNFLL
jgi:hypothetical protein